MNIAQMLNQQTTEQAPEVGDLPALIDTHHGRDRVLSFRALDAAGARFAERIRRSGIGPGDRVLILHPMTAELYAFLIALFRIGAVAMFLDPSAGRAFVERCLQIASPRAFFGSPKAQLLRLWIPALRRVDVSFCTSPMPRTLRVTLDTEGPELKAIHAADESAPALITFTSGSTGQPKAALRTHGFLLAQHRALRTSLHHRAGMMDLTTLPVFVLANLASGITSVIPNADMRRPGHIDARPVLQQLQRLPITTMAASPAFVARLVAECRKSRGHLATIERLFMGGAPVFPEDMRQAHAVFPNAEITAVYGSTEAEPMAEISLSSIGKDDFDAMEQGRGLLAGRPVDSIVLRILRNCWGKPIPALDEAQFRQRCLGPEEVGEIAVAGNHVLPGYLHGAGDAETKFQAWGRVWHRTGDLGWLDRQGRVWLLGRASAAIHDDRGVLYPFAVECVARQIGGVRCAAMVSIAERRLLALEADSAAAADQARRKLEWAALDEIRVLRTIPMDKRHNAKIDYPALRRLLS